MADQTKPSDSQGQPRQDSGSTSPLSPQIKIPPNLPTKDSAPLSNPPSPTSTGGPARPPVPPQSPPRPDIKIKPPQPPPLRPPPPKPPQQPAMPPKTAAPTQPPSRPGPVFKSSIRTMQDDVAAIKKGQAPMGVKLERESKKDVEPPPKAPTGPKVTMPPRPSAQVELGRLEKSKGLPRLKPSPSIPKAPTPPSASIGAIEKAPSMQVPGGGGIRSKLPISRNLLLMVVGLIVIAGLAWFFLLRTPSAPEVVFTPTPVITQTPTPTPIPLDNYFSTVSSVNLSLGADFTSRFGQEIDSEALKLSAEPALYTVFNPETNARYTFSAFLAGLLIQVPAELLNSVSDGDFYMTAYPKLDGNNGYGFVVKLGDDLATVLAMTDWEPTAPEDLRDLLLLDPADASSIEFLDNAREGAAIRYKNFPTPDLTIDYAIVSAINGEEYLVVTNSREHIYSIIDKIR